MEESKLYKSLIQLHNKFEHWIGPLFFLLGIIFDIFTLGRIDDTFNIITQALYLILLFTLLYFEFTGIPKNIKLHKLYQFKDEVFHFFLGALLSAFTLFYFKSSSMAVSFFFMLIIVVLLVINELNFFQKLGRFIKSTLLYLCLLTYFLYLVPLIIGKVGFFPFLFSLLISLIVLFLYLALLSSKGVPRKIIKSRILYPSLSLAGLFIIFYLAKIIPPIPLSVQHIGIYHKVEKNYPEYKLSYEKSWWKFWHTGDQDFKAMPGDKVYVFTRIFAPGGFDDKIILHFKKKFPSGYKTSDKITLDVTGGRGDGFRGFAFKSNYTEGDWRVHVETVDELEIGRINFKIEMSEETPRSFTEIIQ